MKKRASRLNQIRAPRAVATGVSALLALTLASSALAAEKCSDLLGGRHLARPVTSIPPVEKASAQPLEKPRAIVEELKQTPEELAAQDERIDRMISEAKSFEDFTKIPAADRERFLLRGIREVPEFRTIQKLADKLDVDIFLFGGMAATYMDFQINRIAQQKGWVQFNAERMARGNFFDIYSVTQDFDLVADGEDMNIMKFETELNRIYPYMRGRISAWEVRLLTKSRGGKVALLDSDEFLKAHNDSHSTYLIELSGADNQHKIHELHDWDALWTSGGPKWFDDFWRRHITYLHSEKHGETQRAIDGKNPPIFSVIRILNKAFRGGHTIGEDDLSLIAGEIEKFDPKVDLASDYALRWLSWAPKKLVQSPMNLENAFEFMDQTGFRRKVFELAEPDVANLIVNRIVKKTISAKFADFKSGQTSLAAMLSARSEVKKKARKFLARITDLSSPDSMLSWLSKQPLRTKTLGAGSGQTAADLGFQKVIRPISLEHYLDYELLQRSVDRTANVFQDGGAGSGFKTTSSKTAPPTEAGSITMMAEFDVDPTARQGSDFELVDGQIVFHNKAALKVVESSLKWPVEPYFDRLFANPNLTPEVSADELGYWQQYRLIVITRMATLSSKARLELLTRAVEHLNTRESAAAPKTPMEREAAVKEFNAVARELQLILGSNIDLDLLESVLQMKHLPPVVIATAVSGAANLMATDSSFTPTARNLALVDQLFGRFQDVMKENPPLGDELFRLIPKTILARADWIKDPAVHQFVDELMSRKSRSFNRGILKHVSNHSELPSNVADKWYSGFGSQQDALVLSRMLTDKTQRAYVLKNPENLIAALRAKPGSLSREAVANFTAYLETIEPLLVTLKEGETPSTYSRSAIESSIALETLVATTIARGSMVRQKQFWKRSTLAVAYALRIAALENSSVLFDTYFLEHVVERGYLDGKIDAELIEKWKRKARKQRGLFGSKMKVDEGE